MLMNLLVSYKTSMDILKDNREENESVGEHGSHLIFMISIISKVTF